jgi:hypothetical protein
MIVQPTLYPHQEEHRGRLGVATRPERRRLAFERRWARHAMHGIAIDDKSRVSMGHAQDCLTGCDVKATQRRLRDAAALKTHEFRNGDRRVRTVLSKNSSDVKR